MNSNNVHGNPCHPGMEGIHGSKVAQVEGVVLLKHFWLVWRDFSIDGRTDLSHV